MKLSNNLQKKIDTFLSSLPVMHDSESQRAFICRAGLDDQLQNQLPFGRSPAQFVPLLVSTLVNYERLRDGRFAFEAVLESAKTYIGPDKQAYCDTLIQQIRSIDPEISSPTPEADLDESDDDTLFIQLLKHLNARRFDQADAIYQKMQQQDSDTAQGEDFEAFYLHLRYKNGDSFALSKLQRLAQNSENSPHTFYWIGACYEYSGYFEKAAENYLAGLQQSTLDETTSIKFVTAARCLFKSGQCKQAYSLLNQQISEATLPSSLRHLYQGLAELYEKEQKSELQAFALEKALEQNPNDMSLLFDLAFLYSRIGRHELALSRYLAILKFNPSHKTALNNIGVEYSALGLPINCIASYKKAIEQGDTLPVANLALQFIKAGFIEEAQEVLDKARQMESIHSNVGEAIGHIAHAKKTEEETKQKFLGLARKQQEFFAAFSKAYFGERLNASIIEGIWVWADGIEVEISLIDDDKFQGEWIKKRKYGEHEFDERYRIDGEIHRRGAIIATSKYDTTHKIFKKKSGGYGYLSPDYKNFSMLAYTCKEYFPNEYEKDKPPSFMTLVRSKDSS